METYGSVSRLPGRAVGVVQLVAPNPKGVRPRPHHAGHPPPPGRPRPASHARTRRRTSCGSSGTPGPPSLCSGETTTRGPGPKRLRLRREPWPSLHPEVVPHLLVEPGRRLEKPETPPGRRPPP